MLLKQGYFLNSKGENSKDLFKPTFDVMPKKATTAYIFYSISKPYAKNPNASFADQARQRADAWHQMTDKERKPFMELETKDKIRY